MPKGNKIEVDNLFDINSKISGTDIGLAISKQIVELHKGRIETIQDGNKIKFIVIYNKYLHINNVELYL